MRVKAKKKNKNKTARVRKTIRNRKSQLLRHATTSHGPIGILLRKNERRRQELIRKITCIKT